MSYATDQCWTSPSVRRRCLLVVITLSSLCTLFLYHVVQHVGLSVNAACITVSNNCSVCNSPNDLLSVVGYVCFDGRAASSDPLCAKYKSKLAHIDRLHDGEVAIRFIVLTFNRAQSLSRCLDAVRRVLLDDDSAAVDIWIDRSANGTVNAETLAVAQNFSWPSVEVAVRVHDKHVGLYGQWMETWRPRMDSREIALFIEDDVDVAPMAYRWLKKAHALYGERTDIVGYTLQDQNVLSSSGRLAGRLLPRPFHPAYLYRVPGSWGFSPHPGHWRQFQDWFQAVRLWCPVLHPYVVGARLQTTWFRGFELSNRADTMWTIWLIYYTDAGNLFTVYPNLPMYLRRQDASLARNRFEPGLHFVAPTPKGNLSAATKLPTADSSPFLLNTWDTNIARLPANPVKIDYTGLRLL